MRRDERDKTEQKSMMRSLWDKLPLSLKLQIIGGVALILVVFILIFGLISAIPSIFLNYSDEASISDDLKKEYEEFWKDFCEEGDSSCSDEQIKAAQELKESQTKFYKKLDALKAKYNITEEQKYMVLTTIFYNYDIDDFTQGNQAFDFDETDDINYEVDTTKNAYEREKDSLKELIKQFKTETAYCVTTTKNEKNEDVENQDVLRDSQGNAFTFSFFEKVQVTLGLSPNEEFAAAKENCSGTVKMIDSSTSEASIENFYKYLRETDYLDTRPQIRSIFREYGSDHALSDDIASWPQDAKYVVRDRIIEDIKDIVKGYTTSANSHQFLSFMSNTNYWWPIGSMEVVESNGKKYATGDPVSTYISSYAVGRVHPVTGVPSTHSGLDLTGNGEVGVVPIIATKSGVVVYPGSNDPISYPNFESKAAQQQMHGNRTYGNYVIIQHTDGNYSLYGHLHPNSITVKSGDSVEQGQVIGYMGSSGRSTGPHLHFEIRKGTNSYNSVTDPLNYIDPDNPRPLSSLSESFVAWFDANFEGTTGTDETGTKYLVKDVGDGKRTAGPGITLDAQKNKFAERGIDVDNYPAGSYISKEAVDSIKAQVLEEAFSSIETTLSSAGLTLEKEKIEALVVFKYNVGNIKGFADAYKTYGDTQALFDNYFGKYVHVNGEYWPGLMKRRQKEWELFHNHVYV